jgi:hypothetical protein
MSEQLADTIGDSRQEIVAEVVYHPQRFLAITPTEEVTGVTLPIVTERPLPPVGKSLDANGVTIADWNHSYHPKIRLSHGTPLEGGLRCARTEWVHRDDHNKYHKEFFGPEIGEGAELVKQIVFSAAGFVPRQGLQYDGRETAKVVDLSPETRLNLWRSGRIRMGNSVVVRDALLDAAFECGFDGINTTTIDEFLSTRDLKRRFELGSTMLSNALHEVTTPLSGVYRAVREQQQLPPEAPRTIGKFALKLVSQTRRSRAINSLEGHLRVAV